MCFQYLDFAFLFRAGSICHAEVEYSAHTRLHIAALLFGLRFSVWQFNYTALFGHNRS